MLAWLVSLYNYFGGAVQSLWNSVVNVAITLYNYFTSWVNSLISFADGINTRLYYLGLSFSEFLGYWYSPFTSWVYSTVGILNRNIADNFNSLLNYINQVAARQNQNVSVVQENLNYDFSNLVKWILSSIFGPLSSEIGNALGWIARYGNYVLSLLTDLSKLADLIMAFLWSGWLALFIKYLAPVVTFVFRNWRAWIPGVMPVIEDILTSLFLRRRLHGTR